MLIQYFLVGNMDLGIALILAFTAVATSLLGVFLMLRKMSMMVDAISHTVLLGIVISFMFVKDLKSPLLIIGAAIMGLITVFLTETIVKSKKASEDAATGLVFPLLFSIAVIIISTQLKNTHIDIDAVLLGKIELAPFDQFYINNVALGPRLMYLMLGVMALNIIFVKVFYKELKITSFDAALSAALGLMPFLIHYLLMFLVSLTAVTAFDAVGTILVVSLMIGPAATASLITKDLKKLIALSIAIGIVNSLLGYSLAVFFDTNISGLIATLTLITFLLVLILQPQKGIIMSIIKTRRKKDEIDFMVMVFHLNNHKFDEKEVHINNINKELNWSNNKLASQLKKGIKLGYVDITNDLIHLTLSGENYCELKSNEIFNK